MVGKFIALQKVTVFAALADMELTSAYVSPLRKGLLEKIVQKIRPWLETAHCHVWNLQTLADCFGPKALTQISQVCTLLALPSTNWQHLPFAVLVPILFHVTFNAYPTAGCILQGPFYPVLNARPFCIQGLSTSHAALKAHHTPC